VAPLTETVRALPRLIGWHGAGVFVGASVLVGVFAGRGVLIRVLVGNGVLVRVLVGSGVFVRVLVGSAMVGVLVGAGVLVRVGVFTLRAPACASEGRTSRAMAIAPMVSLPLDRVTLRIGLILFPAILWLRSAHGVSMIRAKRLESERQCLRGSKCAPGRQRDAAPGKS